MHILVWGLHNLVEHIPRIQSVVENLVAKPFQTADNCPAVRMRSQVAAGHSVEALNLPVAEPAE